MPEQWKVFHSAIEIAGQMGALVGGLRQEGHRAVGYNTFHTYLNYQQHLVNTDVKHVRRAFHAKKERYDLFHYHFGATLYSDFRDVAQLQELGKKVVMHHWGNDVRVKAKAERLSPFLLDPCNPMTDAVMIEKLKRLGELIPTAILQDYELLDYVKEYYQNIFVLPLAFDVAGTTPQYPRADKKVPLIIHAPTQATFKGTVFVEETLRLLKQKGYPFEYKRIEKMSHEQALAYYRDADIVIDQLLVGTHGVFAVEAMAMGKPVVSYIREDLASTFPSSLPLVSANPVTLQHVLVPYLEDAQLRLKTGRASRKYAEERHDLPQVMRRLKQIYRFVMRKT